MLILRTLNPRFRRCFAFVVFTTIFLLVGSETGAPRTQTPADSKSIVYFPSETGGTGSFFSANLRAHDEPSLLDGARDPAVHAYRINWMAGQSGRSLFVRLLLNREGRGAITIVENPMSPKSSRTLQHTPTSMDVGKFLELVQKSGFWAMPSQEISTSAKAYKMDAGLWLFEGVRNGHYHFVYRSGPTLTPFTDMVHFLTKDLAGLDESAIPHPFPVSHDPVVRPK
jgi:hypothetical protein